MDAPQERVARRALTGTLGRSPTHITSPASRLGVACALAAAAAAATTATAGHDAMLDENLPTFFLKPSTDKVKHHESFYFTQNGSEPDAQYSLHHLDPAANDAKNTYAVALFDAHSPDILYGEVLAKPGWSQPTLSHDEIRKNGGVPPPPQPIYPSEFAIQLYNPDSQVIVRQQTSKWSGSVSWDFSLPHVTFRTPSGSTLDRTQSDPAIAASTPQINFVWRKEGRYGKDMTCYMTGKSTDQTSKKSKKTKDPDIAVAMFSGLKEVTVMEPNLYRIEIEDFKGLEVALLISAAVVRDWFFGNPGEHFHISEAQRKIARARKASSPLQGPGVTPPVMTPQPPPPPAYTGSSQYPPEKAAHAAQANTNVRPPPSHTNNNNNNNAAKRSSPPPLATNQASPRPPQRQQPPQLPPRLDPRAQWEIDAETARLKAQVDAEEREEKKRSEAARRARRKQDAEEERKTRAFLEAEARAKEKEDKERRKKQAAIDKETERLRKQYGDQAGIENAFAASTSPQRYSAPLPQGPWHTQRPPAPQPRPAPTPAQPQGWQYLQVHAPSSQPHQLPKSKKSFWGLRANSEGGSSLGSSAGGDKLKKKKSSMF